MVQVGSHLSDPDLIITEGNLPLLCFHLEEWQPCIANHVHPLVMYFMYVRVGLYSLNIILDLALILHMPELE